MLMNKLIKMVLFVSLAISCGTETNSRLQTEEVQIENEEGQLEFSNYLIAINTDYVIDYNNSLILTKTLVSSFGVKKNFDYDFTVPKEFLETESLKKLGVSYKSKLETEGKSFDLEIESIDENFIILSILSQSFSVKIFSDVKKEYLNIDHVTVAVKKPFILNFELNKK